MDLYYGQNNIQGFFLDTLNVGVHLLVWLNYVHAWRSMVIKRGSFKTFTN